MFGIWRPLALPLVLTCVMGLSAAGCSSRYGADTVYGAASGRVSRTIPGTVLSVRPVTIRGEQGSPIGSVAGALGGGVAGSFLGNGGGTSFLGGLGGAVIGGLLGNAVGEAIGSEQGREYVIRLASGDVVSVIQGVEPRIVANQPVLVIYDRRARVVPDQSQGSLNGGYDARLPGG